MLKRADFVAHKPYNERHVERKVSVYLSMNKKVVILVSGLVIVTIGLLVFLTTILVPQSEPYYNVAIRFVNAAGTFDEEAAYRLLSPDLQAYVDENCPDGVSACLAEYTPDEWGQLIRDGGAVYRRSKKDGEAYDIQLVATYQYDKGFAGVCIYNRTEEIAPDDWRVTAWAGFVPCDDPIASIDGLRSAEAPNRVAP